MFFKKRYFIFLLFLFIIVFSLFYLKYLVINIEDNSKLLRNRIAEEKINSKVLIAEYKTMTTPSRIQGLSKKYLNLHKTKTVDIISYQDFIKKNDI